MKKKYLGLKQEVCAFLKSILYEITPNMSTNKPTLIEIVISASFKAQKVHFVLFEISILCISF